MSNRSDRKAADKKARFDLVVANAERGDDKSGDEHRRAAAHAHVMTHHALEMDTPEAHKAAASAHDKVSDMHGEAAEECEDSEEAPVRGSMNAERKKPSA